MSVPCITDNHMHIDPINGLGIKAVEQFARAGGSHIILVGKTAYDWGINATTSRDFLDAYEKTIGLSREISTATSVKAFPVVGFHPSEFVGLAGRFGLEYAKNIIPELLEILESLYFENRIYGIGEIGRPHFSVEDELMDASNDILCDFLNLASKLDCPVQLHTESFDSSKFEALFKLIKKSGNPQKIIKHFSPPMPRKAEECGVYPSIVSSKESISIAIGESNRFLMETDYIDDLSRPGAVLGPKTVPKRTLDFLEKGIFTEEDVYKIHTDLIERLYGIDMG
ncbi:MAG: TatD family hydrolase [Candidatus Methanofastidiosia archaeon]